MTAESRFPKAAAISCLIHLFVLAGLGWLAGPFFQQPVIAEQIIELELGVAGQDGPAGGDTGTPPGEQSQPVRRPPHSDQRQTASELPELRPGDSPAPASPEAIATEEAAASGMGNSAGGAVSATAGGGAAGSGGSGGRRGTGGGGLAPPGILSQVEPAYPNEARNAGQAGTVVLRIQVLTNGRTGSISVAASSGYELLDRAAIDAVKRWRFIPAKDRSSGKSVVSYTTLPVVFELMSNNRSAR
ncbi:outer membrane transport energization protein TonB [Dendrosporobacter quercicolus]|uniref:Outer membrane transport energization protein TonB n=2 Tax=Dendrosporobacter quercicolus TaxID=146817 RepID=A0A1G9QWV0_9FIRM|nr:outer membrane transport energization protein TonB [Dendrosporobacter quercicolus]